MERRNFVIGLGGIAASAGLVAGSGAFSQISADRDMTVTTANDSGSYISLAPVSDTSEYASTTTDGHVQLHFGDINGAVVNDNAVSWFDNLVEIGNHVNNSVLINYKILDGSGTEVTTSGITLYQGSRDTELVDASIGPYDSNNSAPSTLVFGVEIDTANGTLPTTTQVEITATEDTTV
ncbi:hypothetical protein HWV07_17155 [Natronomonas salina]|uniref:hypothetical protein n=1 Tax=Natronomonas salina TaxID=1710540 RepID=UPI0015B5F815|nr:hypothetical protein [Natronomonas salina]QLD90676.1 hypothetical protein HWV07_17155 [Natronomonas salina]